MTIPKTYVTGNIGLSVGHTWISVVGQATIDVYKNEQQLIPATSAIRVGPQIVHWSLDMNNAKVILVFSQPMNLAPGPYGGGFNPSKIGFFSLVVGRAYYLAFDTKRNVSYTSPNVTNPVGSSTTVSVALQMTLSPFDLNQLKLLRPKAGLIEILARANALYDPQGNGLAPRSQTDPTRILPTTFLPDTVPPKMVNATIDLGLNRIVFGADEPIDPGSVVLPGFHIQASGTDATVSYALTATSAVVTTGTEVIINLGVPDISALKLRAGLVTTLATSFFAIDFRSATDIAGNYMLSIVSTAATQFNVYIADTVPPVVSSWPLSLSLWMWT